MPEIGETLREARMRAKIDVSEVEAATKIRAKYLRALENEEWGLLPGPTFVRSFLRTYPVYLCLIDSSGRRLIDGQTLDPSSPTPTFKAKRFSVLFGHGPQDMRVNGKNVQIRTSSSPIGFEITPTSRRELSQTRLPTCSQ